MEGNTPLHLLKLMSIRENYVSYGKYLKYGLLAKEAELVLGDYKKYFKADQYIDHTEIDFNQFLVEFQNNWHNTNLTEDQHKAYSLLIKNIEKIDLTTAQSCLPSFFALETREQIEYFWENDFNAEKIRNLLDKYEEKLSYVVEDTEDKDVWTFSDFNMEQLDKSNGLPWNLRGMVESLVSLTLNTFVVVGAYTEVGKSAFCLSAVVHIFKHLCTTKSDRPILYCSSEDGPNIIGTRFLMSLFRKTEEEISNNFTAAMKYFYDEYDPSLIKVVRLRGKSTEYLNKQIKKYNPSLVVLDMIDHMKGEGDNKLSNNAENYQWAREVSGNICPVLATTQCSAEAIIKDKETGSISYVKWVPITAMHYSNVDKQGAAETIVMIGADTHCPNERYINIVKAKRGKLTDFACKFNSTYATYEDF